MAEMKYVIIDDICAILFTDIQNHSDFKEGFGTVTGAGRVMINPNRETGGISVQVFGDSFTLKMKAKPEDEWVINRMFNPI